MAVETSSGCGVARCGLLRARRTRSALEVLGRTASRRALRRALSGAWWAWRALPRLGTRCVSASRSRCAAAARRARQPPTTPRRAQRPWCGGASGSLRIFWRTLRNVLDRREDSKFSVLSRRALRRRMGIIACPPLTSHRLALPVRSSGRGDWGVQRRAHESLARPVDAPAGGGAFRAMRWRAQPPWVAMRLLQTQRTRPPVSPNQRGHLAANPSPLARETDAVVPEEKIFHSARLFEGP